MKPSCFSTLLLTIVLIAFSGLQIHARKHQEPWTEKQLMEPAELAAAIKTGVKRPVVFCVGPANYIPGAIYTGALTEEKHIAIFKQELGKLSKDTALVIYCGCCPFEQCPNIRPAMNILNKMKFTNQKLLNLPHNAKVDWIDKGYPLAETAKD